MELMESSEKQQTLTKLSWDELLRPGKRWSLGGEARDFEFDVELQGSTMGKGFQNIWKTMKKYGKKNMERPVKTMDNHGEKPWNTINKTV
jgi:hypothetical protein